MSIAKSLIFGSIGLVAGFALPEAALASPWGSKVHTVRNDHGGILIEYVLKAKRFQQQQRTIRFQGRCDSACTMFLTMPKSQLCVTPGAAFGFHLPYGSSSRANRLAASYMLKSYPAWVRAWLREKGGLTGQIRVMRYEYARQHLPECGGMRVAQRISSNTNGSLM